MSPKEISRRKFIKNLGGGVIGGGVAIHTLSATKAHAKPVPQDLIDPADLYDLALTVNGQKVQARVKADTTLAEFLRNDLKLTGTKISCNHGQCGSCTVLMDDRAVYSCHLLALDAMHKKVTTIEGLLEGEELHPIQQAFIDKDGLQCGFCTPGQIMAAQALIIRYPQPTREQILEGMSGNLCRCAAYPKILEAVIKAAEKRLVK